MTQALLRQADAKQDFLRQATDLDAGWWELRLLARLVPVAAMAYSWVIDRRSKSAYSSGEAR